LFAIKARLIDDFELLSIRHLPSLFVSPSQVKLQVIDYKLSMNNLQVEKLPTNCL